MLQVTTASYRLILVYELYTDTLQLINIILGESVMRDGQINKKWKSDRRDDRDMLKPLKVNMWSLANRYKKTLAYDAFNVDTMLSTS